MGRHGANARTARNLYDVIVVGGGHAGCEAATAASRMGATVALLTHKRSTIGALSCNPSIGGIGKGHLVREVDALDGVMGKAADAAAIQFRTLNSSRGLAVRGPRAQVDRRLYKDAIDELLASHCGLHIIEGAAEKFVFDDGSVAGVETASGETIRADSVILTTGTFLNGALHVGAERTQGGRVGDNASVGIATALRTGGLKLGRMKTGTPPRLDGRTIDYRGLLKEPSDPEPVYFSFLTEHHNTDLVECFQTRTNNDTHDIVREGVELGLLPQFDSNNSPRYCPSLEAKVSRFGDRDGHVVWLEPEGLDSHLVYPAGISTSLPLEYQRRIVNSIAGLENAKIVQQAYAVEYDYVDPTSLRPNLEARAMPRLFLAGQINGTTGYEEAAAQGVIAGINATLPEGDYLHLGRGEAYTGVLLDDLTKLGTAEPYRMLTSRAEYRVSLRPDNADARLTARGREIGVVGGERWQNFETKRKIVEGALGVLRGVSMSPTMWRRYGFNDLYPRGRVGGRERITLAGALERPGTGLKRICNAFANEHSVLATIMKDAELMRHVEAECKYEPHVLRQAADIERLKKDEALRIPEDLDVGVIEGLSLEDREKFLLLKPASIGEAKRIAGVTPAGVLLLRSHAKRMINSRC